MRADFDARWAAEAGAALGGFKEWRLAHPRATLAEVEAALDERWAVARARLLADAALASDAADPRPGAVPCPQCGAALAVRGAEERTLTTTYEPPSAAPPFRRVRRLRGGAFPPWMRSGLLPGPWTPSLHEWAVRLGAWMPFREAEPGCSAPSRTRRSRSRPCGGRPRRRGRPTSRSSGGGRAPGAGGPHAAARPARPATECGRGDGAAGGRRVGRVRRWRSGSCSPPTRLATGRLPAPPTCPISRAAPTNLRAAGDGRGAPPQRRRGGGGGGAVRRCRVGAGVRGLPPARRGARPGLVRRHGRLPRPGGECSFGAGSGQAARWLAAQTREVLGGPRPACWASCAGSADLGAAPAGAEAGLAALAAALRYLETRRDQLAYAAFRAQGYPIGSGAVETANKLVVEARLEGRGHALGRGAASNPMLALRNVVCNDRWAEASPAIAAELRRQARLRREHPARRSAPAPPTGPRHRPPPRPPIRPACAPSRPAATATRRPPPPHPRPRPPRAHAPLAPLPPARHGKLTHTHIWVARTYRRG